MRRSTKLQRVILCGLIGLSPGLALAAPLQINSAFPSDGSPAVSGSAAPTSTPLNLQGYAPWKAPQETLEQVGFGVPRLASSFGRDIPIHKAIALIVPSGWQVYAKTGVSGSMPVTWKAKNEPWTETLKRVLRQSGLEATVNWYHRAVLLRVKPAPKVPPMNTRGYTAWNGSPASGYSGNASVGQAGTSTLPLPGANPVFVLNRGDLILTDLRNWARESGWTVVWQVPEDWQVPNTTTFSGGFRKAVGQVVQALSANGASIHAVFHTANNTVVISGAGGGA